MLTIKPIPMSRAAFDYFTKDNYYTEEEGIAHSEWYGKGADPLKLSGKILPEVFNRIYDGQLEDQTLGNYKEGVRRHRPGLDLTFSAPKSVSILGEVYDHREVLDAHDEAVKQTLAYVERQCVSTRLKRGDQVKTEMTENGLFAIFRHDVSRELDPQTHSHALLMNATYYEGQYRSIHADTLLPHVKEIGLLYRGALYEELQRRGYPLRYTNEGLKYFEIQGVSEAHLRLFSKRSDQIKQRIKALGAEASPALAQRVALYTRRQKECLSRETLKSLWSAELKEHGLKAPRIEKVHVAYPKEEASLTDVVKRGIRRLQSTDIAFTKVDLLTSISKGQETSYGSIDIAHTINDFVAQGLLLVSDVPRGRSNECYYTTQKAKQSEQEILSRFKASKGVFEKGYMSPEKIEGVLDRFMNKPKPEKHITLDEGQRRAIIDALSSRDRYHIIQGNAGAGKTTLLKELRQTIVKELGIVIKRQGQLRAFASTHVAVQELRDSLGIQVMTLDNFLVSATDAALKRSRNEIWVIDEISMTDIRNLKKLMDKADLANARVILVGDANQLESVGPGRALYMADKAGISTSIVDTIYRQENPDLLKVAEQMNDKQHSKGLSLLQSMGHVIETGEDLEQSDENCVNTGIFEHLKQLSGQEIVDTLVVVPTNEDRDVLTLQIRETLKNKGILESQERSRSTLVPRVIPDVELKYTDQYKIGDVIRFNKVFDVDTSRWLTRRITRGEYFDVIGMTQTELLIQSRKENDCFKFDLSKLGDQSNGAVFVYEKKEIMISPGDRLRWLDNKNKHGLMRNNTIDVLSIDHAYIMVKYQDRRIVLDREQLNQQHFEHQYVTTAHNAQGLSANSVIVAAPYWRKNSVNQRSLLVGSTRAKNKLLVFTENAAKLKKELGNRFGDNTMALRNNEVKTILSGRSIL